LVCGVATLQDWPETLAFQTPATEAVLTSEAPAGGPLGAWTAAVVVPGAVGNAIGSVTPPGGGNASEVTVPAGAGAKGCGLRDSKLENRSLWQPAENNAARATTPSADFDSAIPSSGSLTRSAHSFNEGQTSPRWWRNCNPIWLKYGVDRRKC
jgi:hypothetical protein